MNEQQLFDVAYAGLAKQGFMRSVTDRNSCAYRGPNGFKCAIGQAIPDEKYQPEMDSCEGPNLVIILESIGYHGDYDFATRLQSAHDGAMTPERMRERLQDLAGRFGLRVNTGESAV